ncbi:MAG TPA: NYN domain-containing protein [Dehalococcoidia bacterium]|nr:NYN domain-containing protein [Dehalococcoidia bacterium]
MAVPQGLEADVALLIDWENIKFSLQERGLKPNISALREEAEELGRVVLARAYADFEDPVHRGDPPNLYAAGIEPVYVPVRVFRRTRAGDVREVVRKNSVDVKLTADCIEFCHRYPGVGTYVLVSGDGDFIHIVNALRPYQKRVVVIAVSWSASARLVESADRIIYYDRDVEPLKPPPAAVAPVPAQPTLEEVLEAIHAITAETRREGRTLLLAQLKQELLGRYGPDFSERRFGFSRFKLLAREAARRGLIKVVTQGLVDWAFLADEEGVLEEGAP